MNSKRAIRPTSSVAFQRKQIFTEDTIDLSQTGTPVCDLWVNVTNTVHPINGDSGLVETSTGFITLPDVEQVVVYATSQPNITEGNFKIASTAYQSDGAIVGLSESYVTQVRRTLDMLVGEQEIFDERTISETSLTGLSVLETRETDVDFKDFETDSLLLDATYKGKSSPPCIIRYASDGKSFITPAIWMHAGKYIPREGGIYGAAYEDLTLKAKVYITYKTYERESFDSMILSQTNKLLDQPYFAVPVRVSDLRTRIEDPEAQQIAERAYLAGYDINIDPRFSFSSFFQKVIGVVKTAAPVIATIAGVLKEDLRRSHKPSQITYDEHPGLGDRRKEVNYSNGSNSHAYRGPVGKKRGKQRAKR